MNANAALSGGAPAVPAPAALAAIPLSPRLVAGLVGIFLAAVMAGLNNRVGALGLVDVRGALGFGSDDASWLTTAYAAGELAAMPFATWFAITLSLRRFHIAMVATCLVLALAAPLVQNLPSLLLLRSLQGLANGALIPLLMMAALRFLPPPVRLYGLALYSMTATFAPNIATWLTAQWSDGLTDWRLIYWHVVPLAAVCIGLVGWGIPSGPVQSARFTHANWFGMAFGLPGLCVLAVALDQGGRLDWFNSPFIAWALGAGIGLTGVFLLSEWFHPAPFIKLQLLGRRNLGLGFSVFFVLLVVMTSGSLLPSAYLASVQGYRALQSAPVGLIVGLPQLVLAPLTALLLYRKWIDARMLFATGLLLIAVACLLGSRLTSEWIGTQFVWAQVLQCVGQPLAVVPMLFLATSVVQPPEGPYVSGIVNTLRALGSLAGGSMVAQLLVSRSRFHAEMLLDAAGLAAAAQPAAAGADMARAFTEQAQVLASADAYRVLGALALLLIPAVLSLQYIGAPGRATAAPISPNPAK